MFHSSLSISHRNVASHNRTYSLSITNNHNNIKQQHSVDNFKMLRNPGFWPKKHKGIREDFKAKHVQGWLSQERTRDDTQVTAGQDSIGKMPELQPASINRQHTKHAGMLK